MTLGIRTPHPISSLGSCGQAQVGPGTVEWINAHADQKADLVEWTEIDMCKVCLRSTDLRRQIRTGPRTANLLPTANFLQAQVSKNCRHRHTSHRLHHAASARHDALRDGDLLAVARNSDQLLQSTAIPHMQSFMKQSTRVL